MIPLRTILIIFLFLFFFMGIVSGHTTWTIPDSGTVETGNVVSLAVGSSHAWGTSEEVPEGYMVVALIDQDGNREVKTGDHAKIAGLYRVFPYPIRNKGLYRVTIYHTEGTWTHIVMNPPDRDGGLWINKGIADIDISQLDTTAWSDAWYIETSFPVHCYAKTFLVSGDADFSLAGEPTHSTLEILARTDIRRIGTGNFSVEVLYKGAPLSGTVVLAGMPGNEDTVVTAITDSAGRAVLPLNRSGTWMIKADTGTDPRVVSLLDLQKGPGASQKTTLGPVYRYTLVLRSDYSGKPTPDNSFRVRSNTLSGSSRGDA